MRVRACACVRACVVAAVRLFWVFTSHLCWENERERKIKRTREEVSCEACNETALWLLMYFSFTYFSFGLFRQGTETEYTAFFVRNGVNRKSDSRHWVFSKSLMEGEKASEWEWERKRETKKHRAEKSYIIARFSLSLRDTCVFFLSLLLLLLLILLLFFKRVYRSFALLNLRVTADSDN